MNRLRIRGLPIAESILHTRRTILRSHYDLRKSQTLSSLPYSKETKDAIPVSPRGPSITCKASRQRVLPVCE